MAPRTAGRSSELMAHGLPMEMPPVHWSSSLPPSLPVLELNCQCAAAADGIAPLRSFFSGSPSPPITSSLLPDLTSILPYLPIVLRGGALFWPPQAQEALKALALVPDVSRVSSGDVLTDTLTDLRLALNFDLLQRRAVEGFTLLFEDLLSRAQTRDWFDHVLPSLARLLLCLPMLLETLLKLAAARRESSCAPPRHQVGVPQQ
ncbi:hypothetical protein E2562_019596 [Oryza meyeriana var. granulata]|uniref:Uncharacterized protein n=1 Tax=Oryza meyeriana var. granulata TaxID=110450 RepID=A0A6G1EXB6_9ORYZ|nr:hypothetical protein E2562_019596 [Oryza meyeriana var. granulata]